MYATDHCVYVFVGKGAFTCMGSQKSQLYDAMCPASQRCLKQGKTLLLLHSLCTNYQSWGRSFKM